MFHLFGGQLQTMHRHLAYCQDIGHSEGHVDTFITVKILVTLRDNHRQHVLYCEDVNYYSTDNIICIL